MILTPELVRLHTMLTALLQRIMAVLSVLNTWCSMGTLATTMPSMARQCGLHLISKLRCDAALYLPYTGAYAGRGPRRKYGHKIDYDHLPGQYLKETTVEGHIQTCIYQAPLLRKEFQAPLNVVIIAKTNLRTCPVPMSSS